MPLPFFGKKEKTLDEETEENERLKVKAQNADLQLSVAEREAMMAKLRANGLTVDKTFGRSVKAAWQWVKTH